MSLEASPPLLEMRGIVKRFLGIVALDHVDFEVRAGEVHALMGENGAGKSTLIKTLTGVHPLDEGSMLLQGAAILPRTPDEAVRQGISTVYQEVNLVPNLSVAENVCLGREPRGPFGIRWREMNARAESAVNRLGLNLDVRRPLGSCSIAVQQMVAIARALDVSAKVLVLDEPTSSLDSDEVGQLFDAVRRLKADGLGIVFVTHFLDQVYEICDRVTILRNGSNVGTWPIGQLSRLELVSQMIGRDASALERAQEVRQAKPQGEPFFTADSLGRRGAVSNVSFDLGPGEVLGFAGLLGSGRTEAIRLAFGLDSPDQGTLHLDGKTVHRLTPRAAIRKGIGLLPEDRKVEGLFPELTIRENILIVLQARQGWLRKIPLRTQKALASELATRLQVQPPDIERPIQNLSGGNQQKALIARWLAVQPRLLLLDEPTRGIDVGAKFEIMSLVESLRSQGTSFAFVSSELSEVVRASTKVVVMRDRKAVETLDAARISEEGIIHEIAGASE
jgi:simple sugar transport system ATP-binding protein